MITIYGLVDPRFELDGGLDIRYIGKTIEIPYRRLRNHINKAKSGSAYYVHCWIRQLLGEGMEPSITVLEEIPEGGDWVQAECAWIATLLDEGYNLTNLTEGGEGAVGCIPSNETRHKMSEYRRGRIPSDETRRKMSIAQRKRFEDPKARAFLGALRKGHKHSDETRRRISESHRGRKHSDEARYNMSIARKKYYAAQRGSEDG